MTVIDALFGSKTRVKLLHLFLNNPGKAFYVREITRLIDEQINSVRRELANMLAVGIITSDTSDNKLYYKVEQRYQYYVPLRAIFGEAIAPSSQQGGKDSVAEILQTIPELRLVVASGVLKKGSTSSIDLLLVGSIQPAKLKRVMKAIESNEGRELNYALISYDEFYYRRSIRDKFITEIMQGPHEVLVDADNTLE